MDKNDALDLQKALTKELADSLLACIHQFDGEVTLATVLGVLSIVSHTLIAEA